jgi:drug/metabolite transporter (DMT)-like permease
MHWLYYAGAAALALGAADTLVKLASGKLPDSLGMLLYGIVPFLTGLVWFARDHGNVSWSRISPAALLYALGVGVTFSFVTFGMYAAFRHGAPLSLASPLVRLGGLIVASVAGILAWKEPFTIRYLAGSLMTCAGLYLMLTQ